MEGSVKRVAVVGGVNVDICGHSDRRILLHDSNPGSVTVKPGGVGRNIAHNLRLLGADVCLVSAIGGDSNAKLITDSCEETGIDLSLSRFAPDRRCSTYLYVTDEHGDMCVGINDMSITSLISGEYLLGIMDKLNGFDAVVIDANLDESAILTLAQHCTAPMYADPVSAAKCHRLECILPRLRMIKPNEYEAEGLTGECSIEKAADALLAKGVQRVFISAGSKGMLGAEKGRSITRPRERAKVVNTTGAGDAATAAIVYADLLGLSLEESIDIAQKAGALTCECDETNSPRLRELIL